MIIHRKCKPRFAYGFEISNKKSNQLFFRIVFLRHGAKRLLLHSRFFRNCLPKKGWRHIFWNQNSTISSYDAKEEAKKTSCHVYLHFEFSEWKCTNLP